MGSEPINYRLVFSKFRENYGPVIFTHYVLAPLGIIVLLIFSYLTDLLIDLLPFTFPSQAIAMIFLFILLIVLHRFSPHFLFHHVHSFLHPAAEFLLACMGLFFTSSFILIPRRDVMPGKEIGLIAALFLPSLIITWVGTVMIVKAMAYVWPQAKVDEPEEDNNADVLESDSESGESSKRNRSRNNSQASIGSQVSHHHHRHHHHHHSDDSVLASVEAGQSVAHPAPPLTSSPRSPNSLIELHSPGDPPPPTEKNPQLTLDNNLTLCATEVVEEEKEKPSDPEKKGWHDSLGRCTRSLAKMKKKLKVERPNEDSTMTGEERLARRLEVWFDPAVYLLVLLIGIPLFFTPGGERRTMPLFTGVVALAWLFSRRFVSAPFQKVFHPILVTSFITVFVVWGFGAIKGLTLTQALNHYSTGAQYLILFRRSEGWDGSSPSAGDLLSSLLVGGIVALAFPMFRYRADLYNNFFRLFVVVMPNCAVSLLFWPWVASKMGMAGDRAITFAARFMSTPFGIQFIVATGGDNSLVVVLICITGIFAVIVRDPLFKLCRTRTTPGSDEYFTIGCTIGIIAAAIGTSSLMSSHSRAAATSTVTFVVYGLALLALVAVPAIANFVGTLAGL
ncbi:uncharacterized protein PGTG_05602 [Puccinia graminis f. sp. tritici CRL 75-36-700-3]|uniref:Uncharacterized protein n=1 Tax=Puccinia graminis f. sp. tritici (strain CRL 75-36-700-3 / race SCCL) TaxID=418459 RepID=E3K4W6_PUCGT|nr:uncharacterized protein PGTG_05602 [Puccinia graminis f. sp. tritici CRL 75-36-700-3]EFP79281.1 hypothetical protein PGTG_05602 [Puccinia graminis f. sp. tritici CRL 75-36-700-3]